MNKYIYPVFDDSDISIKKVSAKSYNDAKNKIIQHYFDDLEWDCPDTWNEFLDYAYEQGVIIGDPTDIELV